MGVRAMNSPKQKIIQRIRKGISNDPPSPEVPRSFIDPAGHWDLEARLHRFQDELTQVRGEAFVVRSRDELRHKIEAIVNESPSGSVLMGESPWIKSLGLQEWIGEEDRHHLIVSSQRFDPKEGKQAVIGITEASYGIAETGTVFFKSDALSPLLLSLSPQTHIALLPAQRLFGSLDQIFEKEGSELFRHRRDSSETPFHALLVTGPSRTADIEKTIILGMHAPQKLYVIIVLE